MSNSKISVSLGNATADLPGQEDFDSEAWSLYSDYSILKQRREPLVLTAIRWFFKILALAWLGSIVFVCVLLLRDYFSESGNNEMAAETDNTSWVSYNIDHHLF